MHKLDLDKNDPALHPDLVSAETDLEELKDATKSYRKEFRVSNKGSSFYSFAVIFLAFIF